MDAWNGRRRFGLGLAAMVLGAAVLARANAPCGRYVVTADTVLDTATQLTWQRQASSGLTWNEAVASCTNGWRVPRLKELQTLVDVSRREPAIDSDAFPDTPAERFWTATIQASDTNSAWCVNFNHGATTGEPLTAQTRVRCVR